MVKAKPEANALIVFFYLRRDVELVCQALTRAGIQCRPCHSAAEFVREMDGEASGAIIAEECLTGEAFTSLKAWIDRQPPWSDFPLIVLTTGGESTGASLEGSRRIRELGNVTLLERPLRIITIVSAANAAIRSRVRQHQAEAYISELKMAEEALTAQAGQLARSNADLQQFAYVTSHDLQEPLRTMASFAQMLSRKYTGKLDADADEYLSFIIAGASRMRALIDDLLTYSRVLNVETSARTQVRVSDVVHWAIMNLQTLIDETSADVIYTELPTVIGDTVQLVQLFQNLIGNAIKYRGREVPKIRITCESRPGEWLFAVQDNGIGIAPQYAEQIFGVFKRLHKQDVPGTGIGLAICKHIVEKHGGRIWVESREQDGATFYFTIADG
ncbi:MAG TPA: ATP-binding protein [Bryobacteraceae bacterium]|nr:ATP-binding protein [Bryobacteraceae bacterium]